MGLEGIPTAEISVRELFAATVVICAFDVFFFDVKNFKIPIVFSGSQVSDSIELAVGLLLNWSGIGLACGKANSEGGI